MILNKFLVTLKGELPHVGWCILACVEGVVGDNLIDLVLFSFEVLPTARIVLGLEHVGEQLAAQCMIMVLD